MLFQHKVMVNVYVRIVRILLDSKLVSIMTMSEIFQTKLENFIRQLAKNYFHTTEYKQVLCQQSLIFK